MGCQHGAAKLHLSLTAVLMLMLLHVLLRGLLQPGLRVFRGMQLAPEITAAALDGDLTAIQAVDMFVAIVGAEAGAMALRSLAFGGCNGLHACSCHSAARPWNSCSHACASTAAH